MDYALILSVSLYLCGCFYLFFGIYAIYANIRSKVNRMFFYLTATLGIWAFCDSIVNSASSAEVSAFWRAFSVFGWGVFYAILIHFIINITDNKVLLSKPRTHFLIYAPAFINVILFAPFGFLHQYQNRMAKSEYGWINAAPPGFVRIWLVLYFAIYSLTGIFLLLSWWKEIKHDKFIKRHVIYFMLSVILPSTVGILSNILPNIPFRFVLLKTFIFFNLIPTITLFTALKRYGIFHEKEKTVYVFHEGEIEGQSSRLRLFETTSIIFLVGSFVSFLIGYFFMKKPLNEEIFLSASVFIIALISKYIPFMTKKHSVQNALFLLVCMFGMVLYTLTAINVGGLTTWTVYIIFLLFTVVLGTPVHALIHASFVILIQVVLWIFYPEVTAVINGNEYAVRIGIIILSFFSIRYVTREYTSKEKEYKRFAQEQMVLEKISTSFIAVNSENVTDKIQEMFKMSLDVLNFNHAYLVEFDNDYVDAKIIDTFVNEQDSESFPLTPGMTVKMADFPVFEPLIKDKKPIMCEDINKISLSEGAEQREFFSSRGINSYFAIPVIMDGNLISMLVIEYFDKSDVYSTENRLFYLKILANMLADSKKKILYEEKLYNFAYFDEATKLANRNMLNKNLESLIQDRKETDRLAVFNIELDNLRTINDTFGHAVGEQVVIKSVEILSELLNNCCLISRVTEEKFIVVSPACSDIDKIEERAKRIIESFKHPILFPGLDIEALFVIVNIGIAVFPEDGRDTDTLLKNSDLANFEAASTDERIVFCSDQLKDRVNENTLMTHRLFRSLQNQEFSLEFQPQVSCRSSKTVGIEALLRWTTSDKKRIPPDKFIPILEQTGLIHEVGLWVLEQALLEHNRLIANGFPPLRVSVNLSIVQFRREDFVDNVIKLIKKHRVDPKYIELEITESMLSQNFDDTIDKLHQLKKSGLNIAVDDFGKGYSSLHRLILIPFDRIKIDKTIIDNITSEKKSANIARIIIMLAKTLKADITAEGVETSEQAHFVRDIACDEIQGYYYSRPLPAEALEKFLKEYGTGVRG